MATHFEHRIVPAGEWQRCNSQGEGLKGNSDEPRPHFVPLTEDANTYMKAAMFLGGTGLCPGIVQVDGGTVLAFRFIQLPDDPEQILQMLDDLDDEVRSYVRSVA